MYAQLLQEKTKQADRQAHTIFKFMHTDIERRTMLMSSHLFRCWNGHFLIRNFIQNTFSFTNRIEISLSFKKLKFHLHNIMCGFFARFLVRLALIEPNTRYQYFSIIWVGPVNQVSIYNMFQFCLELQYKSSLSFDKQTCNEFFVFAVHRLAFRLIVLFCIEITGFICKIFTRPIRYNRHTSHSHS